MPLILAIEPDRRQASKIAALAKSPLHAELVVAESTTKALAALGDRIPDLILTSLLLSPKDEAALADRLRELDSAGAHVQTLVIPVLAAASYRTRKQAGGLLTRLRRSKGKGAAPDGCDPAVFAAQIAEYLDRAAADSRTAAAALEDELPSQQDPVYATRREAHMAVASSVTRRGEPAAEEPPSFEQSEVMPDPTPVEVAPLAVEKEAVVEPERRIGPAVEPLPVPEERVYRAPQATEAEIRRQAPEPASPPEEDTWEEIVFEDRPATPGSEAETQPIVVLASEPINLAAFVEELNAAERTSAEPVSATELLGAEPESAKPVAKPATAKAVGAVLKAAREDAACEAAARKAAASEAAAREAAARKAAARETAARATPSLSQALPTHPQQRSVVAMPGDAQAIATASKVPAGEPRPPAEVTAPSLGVPAAVSPPASATQPEWINLLSAIKRDIEHLRSDMIDGAAEPAEPERSTVPGSARSKPAASRATARPAPNKKRKKAPAPIQDEWGFFDPEQCGFAALLAKLDEITEQEETPAKKPTQRSR